jgi:D-3-phosphoglycerate dehydrogenase / 2-oxoglutarate reductase
MSSRWRCLRTEIRDLPSYDSRVERSILEPAGIVLESVDMNEPGVFERVAGTADAVLHSRGVLDDARIALLTRCRIISHYGTGVDRVDVAAATSRGIWVTNGPRYAVDEVSSHAIGLLLAVARKIVADDHAVRRGEFHIKPIRPVHRITGRTLGLLGFGNIARATGRKGRGLGLNVIAHDPYVDAGIFEREGVQALELAAVLSQSDYVSVHLPLTAETRNVLDRGAFSAMKPGAIVINTSRGAVIDEAALVDALASGHLAGAGLDVFAEEPPPVHHPLLQLPNVVVTGHIGFYSEESIEHMQRDAAEQVVQALSGRVPEFLVNRQVAGTSPRA